jgi:tripartite-type tricarboxylate transporter receptor subunit TctC
MTSGTKRRPLATRRVLRSAACTVALAGLALPASGAERAADWPTRPLRCIVPFAPGGSTDVIARVAMQKVAEALGQQVIVDNRPGAASNLGTELAARATPDGYTLLMGTPGLAINPSLYRKTPFDPQRDFTPVTYMALAPLMVVVHPSVPARTLAEFVAHARSRPGAINYASAGSSTHLAAELFRRAAGIEITHVPYKGSAPATNDVIAGQVQMMVDNVLSALPHVRSGKLRALAVTSARRAPSAPEVPAIAEVGYPGFEAASWFGMLVPARTPQPVVERLSAEINRALTHRDTEDRYAALGVIRVGGTPAEFRAFIDAEIAKWSKLIRDTGLRAES